MGEPPVPSLDCCDPVGYGGAVLEIVDEGWAPIPSSELDSDAGDADDAPAPSNEDDDVIAEGKGFTG